MKKVIYIAIALVVAIKLGILSNPLERDSLASTPEFVNSYEGEVVLYATSWCGYCEKTRTLLSKNGIEYTEYDIENSRRGKDEYDQLNGNGIPLLVINGEIIRGYNPSRILKLANDT